MTNPYILLGLLIAWLASLTGVGVWQNHAGHTAERLAWQERQLVEARNTATAINQAHIKARAAEQASAEHVAQISAEYERRLQDAKKSSDAALAAVRAGAVRLRDPGATTLLTCGSQTGEAGTAAGERDGSEGGELSQPLAEFLVGLASECDNLAHQLSAAQQVIIDDREGD